MRILSGFPTLIPLSLLFVLSRFAWFSSSETLKFLGKERKNAPKKQGKSRKEKNKEIQKSKERGIGEFEHHYFFVEPRFGALKIVNGRFEVIRANRSNAMKVGFSAN